MFPKNTISVGAASRIFGGVGDGQVSFESVFLNGDRVGFTAQYQGQVYESSSITELCERLWAIANQPRAAVESDRELKSIGVN